jgi:hypothetical protein
MLSIKRSVKRPSRAIGFLAALGVFPHAEGSGAPGIGRGSGAGGRATNPNRSLVVLVSLCVSVAALLCVSAPALAAAPAVSEESVTEVSAEGATLHAVVNPEGATASYRFEYDTIPYAGDVTHGQSVPSPEETVEGAEPVTVEAHIQGLSAATAYHYRLVATNTALETEYGTDATFTTQAKGGEFQLPDDRAWEMVTPPDKHGARIEAMTKEGGIIQASEDGSAIGYIASSPVTSDPEGNPSVNYAPVFSKRGPSGWETEDLSPKHTTVSYVHPDYLDEYTAFSSDLDAGLLEEPNNSNPTHVQSPSPLDPALASEETIYIRQGLGEGGEPQYVPLVNDSNANGAHYGQETAFLGSTGNLEHVVLRSHVSLETGSSTGAGLYEWDKDVAVAGAGVLHPVGILPDGDRAAAILPSGARQEYASLGNHNSENARNAISSDGEKVFWTYSNGSEDEHLYMRNTVQEATVQIDLPQDRAEPNQEEDDIEFQYATPDGSRVYFTDNRPLTPDSRAENASEAGRNGHPQEQRPELFEYNFDRPLGERLTDLTPGESIGESANVQGSVIGVSEGGEGVFYVADGVLGDATNRGECEGEQSNSATVSCNLYMTRVSGGTPTTTLIAVLAGADEHDWRTDFGGEENPGGLTSRSSPDGGYLAFMSERSLTGYDNADEVSGERDEEVFLYDASTGKLVCASCNPTGARPRGVEDGGESGSQAEGLGLLVDRPSIWAHRWLAGSVPGWTRRARVYAQYQSRYLSNEGRLFFDAADALVPDDVNGKEDVYEYEPQGVGPKEAECGSGSSSGSVVFKPEHSFVDGEGQKGEEAAGCVGLISSGTSAKESAFLDASAKGPSGEEGEDVFFLTAEQLSPADIDSADDIYDAHVCSAVSPCSAGAVSSPPCTTADSCRAASAPQPAIFGAPASATFAGAGNVTPAAVPSVVAKVKPLTRAQKLANALKACKKKKKGSKRTSCEKQARSKYGAKSKSKSKIKSKSHKGGK